MKSLLVFSIISILVSCGNQKSDSAIKQESQTGSSDMSERYRIAHQAAKNANQSLWVVISRTPIDISKIEFPKTTKAVFVSETTEISEKRQIKDAFDLSPDEISNGVAVIVDFSDPLLTSFGAQIAKLSQPQTKSKKELQEFLDKNTFVLSADEREMAKATNDYRARYGRGPLQVSRALTEAARATVQLNNTSHAMAKTVAKQRGLNLAKLTEIGCKTWRGPRSAVIDFWGEEGSPLGHQFTLRGLMNLNGSEVDGKYNAMGPGRNGDYYLLFFSY